MAGTEEITRIPDTPLPLEYIPEAGPVSPGAYIALGVEILATPDDSTDWPHTEDVAEPLVLALEETPNREREDILCALVNGYLPMSEREVPYRGRINPGQASRNLVAEIAYRTQTKAFEKNDPELSAQMVWVAQQAVHKELAEGGDPKAVPGLLVGVLQRALIEEHKDAHEPGSDDSSPAARWYDELDAANIQHALSGLLLADRLNLREPAVVDFMLKQWGLNPSDMRHAWAIGFRDPHPEQFLPEALVANLQHIAHIEQDDPGIAALLRETNKIRCFTRLSPKSLRYLDSQERARAMAELADFVEEADAPGAQEPASEQESPIAAAITTAGSDHNNAFKRPGTFEQLFDKITDLGHVGTYYEVASVEEQREVWDAFARLGVKHALEGAHCDADLAVLDETLPVGEGLYTVDDLRDDEEHIRATHTSITDLRLWGCDSGVRGGLAQTYADILRGGVVVVGLARILGVKLCYVESGFGMWKDEKSAPTPTGQSRAKKGIAEPIAGLLPATKKYQRYSDQQEATLAMWATMQERQGF